MQSATEPGTVFSIVPQILQIMQSISRGFIQALAIEMCYILKYSRIDISHSCTVNDKKASHLGVDYRMINI